MMLEYHELRQVAEDLLNFGNSGFHLCGSRCLRQYQWQIVLRAGVGEIDECDWCSEDTGGIERWSLFYT